MLVDDEPKVLRGLRTMVEHSGENWTITGEFKNGVEALAAIINHSPDAVITDIKMPCMNGLELAERARELNPMIQFIVLSGFAEFTYAQQAVRLGTADYILKPPDHRDIIKNLKKIEFNKEKAETEKKSQAEFETLKKNTILYAQDSQFTELLYKSPSNVVEKTDFIKSTYALFIIKPDYVLFPTFSEDDTQLKLFSLFRKKIQEAVHSRNGYLADLCDSSFCFLLNLKHRSIVHLKNLATEIRDEIGLDYKESMTIGISRTYDAPEQLNTAFQECLYVLRNKVFHEKNSIICISEIEVEQTPNHYPLDLEYKYIEAVKFANESSALNNLSQLINKIISISNHDQALFKSFIMEFILVVVENICEDRQIEARNFPPISETYKKLITLDNIEDIKKLLIDYTQIIVGYFESKNKPGCRKIINDIKAYINSNYFSEISLRQISMMFNINESYLSDLFKKEAGVSFSSYISNVRVDRSKQLLRQIDLKPGDIAEMVGYGNANYFFRVFKKHTGLTPYEYREKVLNDAQ